ncbi:putative ubiquitin-like-specific protease 1B isoform X1 [Nicotiana tabacum]|uniref:Ubiquitin-like-specific protease 1B isoform X1 n=1 Tax=Nicotiana tabacum TaxID=4097 RepID=A0AC58T5W1_TOBAC
MFFLELSDSKFVLDDKHIDIALYYLRKKECYHPRDHHFRCTTTDVLFDNYMALVYKDFSEDASDEFWCAGDNQLFLTPYVWGDSRRCGIAWTEVDKIFFPCRLPSEDDEAVTHFLLGVLDLNQKKIDVYDSIYSEPYEAGMNYMQMYARMIPHLLKFSQFDKNHKSFGNVFNKFDIQWQRSPHQTGSTDCGAFLIKFAELLMIGKDVQQFQPEDIKDFRKELAANLWAHGEWKRNSGYDTPPENVGDDYGSENETFCPKEL